MRLLHGEINTRRKPLENFARRAMVCSMFFHLNKKVGPNFASSRSKNPFTAIWLRLPYLPAEFYDKSILEKIGSLLKIDTCTSSTVGDKYARIYVQVHMETQCTQKSRLVTTFNQYVMGRKGEQNVQGVPDLVI